MSWERRVLTDACVPPGSTTAGLRPAACETGIDVVYVSNHGGRQLDHGRGSIDVLPEVVEAVAE